MRRKSPYGFGISNVLKKRAGTGGPLVHGLWAIGQDHLLLVSFRSVLVVVVTFFAKSAGLFLAAADQLLPVRILAAIALVAVIVAFVHVLRHLKSIEQTIEQDDLVPAERGPRDNVLLIVCAIPIIVVTLLLYLVIKT
jgi:hypothetical protein